VTFNLGGSKKVKNSAKEENERQDQRFKPQPFFLMGY
jgi:hypothetical protein